MIKAISRRIMKVQSDIRQRKAVLVWFSAWQRCVSLQQALNTYHDIHLLLCSKGESQKVSNAKERLTALATGMPLPDLDVEQYVVDDDADGREVESSLSNEGTLKERSPFTHIFNSIISSEAEDDEQAVTNPLYSPKSFKILQDIVHLFPLWSAILQTQPKRFACDDNTSNDTYSCAPRCLTNGLVESHFKSIKHGRLGYSNRVRPRVFLECEVTYVLGKLNEQMLPATPRRAKKVIEGSECTTEKWSKRKVGKYSSTSEAAKILKTLPSRTRKPVKVFSPESKDNAKDAQSPSKTIARKTCEDVCPEYDDIDIEQHLTILRNHFPSVKGLQSTLLGQYIPGSSVPKFDYIAVDEKFVQVLHNYDHWVCVTNMFSDDSHDIYVYDSLNTTLAPETVVQTSSLLRLNDDRDFVNFHVRNYQNQTSGSRLCGLYAVAAATAACQGIDLTSHILDEEELVSTLSSSKRQQKPLLVPSIETTQSTDIAVIKKMMIYCVCQKTKHYGDMIQCSICLNWFHQTCMGFRGNDLPNLSQQWQCKFCSVLETTSTHVIDVDDGTNFLTDAHDEDVKHVLLVCTTTNLCKTCSFLTKWNVIIMIIIIIIASHDNEMKEIYNDKICMRRSDMIK